MKNERRSNDVRKKSQKMKSLMAQQLKQIEQEANRYDDSEGINNTNEAFSLSPSGSSGSYSWATNWDFDSFPGAGWIDYALNQPAVECKNKKKPIPSTECEAFFDPSYCSLQTNKEVHDNEKQQELIEEQLFFSEMIMGVAHEGEHNEAENMINFDEDWKNFDEDWNAVNYNSDCADDDDDGDDSDSSWGGGSENRGWVDYTSPEQMQYEEQEAEEKNALIDFEKDKEDFVPSVDFGVQCDMDDGVPLLVPSAEGQLLLLAPDLQNNDEDYCVECVSEPECYQMTDDEPFLLEDCEDDCEVIVLSDFHGPKALKINHYDDEPWMESMFECDYFSSTAAMKSRVYGYTFSGVGVAPCNGDQFRTFADFLDAGLKNLGEVSLDCVYLGNIYAKGGFGTCDIIFSNTGDSMWNADTKLKLIYGSSCGISETEVHVGAVDIKENVHVQMNFGKLLENACTEKVNNAQRGLSMWALCSGGTVFGTALAVNRV